MNPRKHSKNIAVDPSFPDRVRDRRTDLRLTKAELAEKSGLSIRTLQDIEAGRKSRIQEKTLHLLADALGVGLDVLVEPTPRIGDALDGAELPDSPAPPGQARRARNWLVLLALPLLVSAVGLSIAWNWSRHNAEWTLEDRQLVVRDALLGLKLWEIAEEPLVRDCRVSPWSSDQLLVGLNSHQGAPGRLRCLDRATGDTLWTLDPDLDALCAALDPEDVVAYRFGCNSLKTCDLNGDGELELLVNFVHGKYYPDALCVVDRHGRLQSQYAHRGHLLDVLVVDLDADGRDEILALGTNNAPAYQGATIVLLDDAHRSGASVDSLSNPWSTEPDSARVRLVLPQFPEPFMSLLGEVRLAASTPRVFQDPGGRTLISADVGITTDKQNRLTVYLDTDLNPVGAQPTDSFTATLSMRWPEAVRSIPGPLDPDWRTAWLSTAVRFEAGHWPPSAGR
jgi:transcriptional regulator with XRE-family HTH domain